ncbi:hypothetical protein WN55_05855 [Dufourea novaeangliae]|uniref:Uncharacterized protein n=1 Tax=Dufourea novaeangliae TaxID=178035 RepID=A0A154P092_DUFNO|nr:hypothetical protein WN55_05855 [Dufourea novaeangliae]
MQIRHHVSTEHAKTGVRRFLPLRTNDEVWGGGRIVFFPRQANSNRELNRFRFDETSPDKATILADVNWRGKRNFRLAF